MRPNLGKIKRIKWKSFCLLKCHDLDVKSPGGIVAGGNGIKKVPDAIVRIFLGKSCCIFNGKVFDALVSLIMEFAINRLSFSLTSLKVCDPYPFMCLCPSGIPRSLNRKET